MKESVALLRQCDDHVQLALALTALSRARHYTAGQWADDPVIEAVELVRDDASPESLGVLAYAALHLAIQEEDWEGGVQMADRALAISAELGLGVDVRALGARASARCHAGDRGGIDDFRQAIDEALDRGLTLEACHLQTNLAISETWWVGPKAQISGLTQALRLARRCGSELWGTNARVLIGDGRFLMGDWDKAVTELSDLVPDLSASDSPFLVTPYGRLVQLSIARGTNVAPVEAEAWLKQWSVKGFGEDVPLCINCLVALSMQQDRLAEARRLLEDGLSGGPVNANYQANLACDLPWLARSAVTLGRPHSIGNMVAQLKMTAPFFDFSRAAALAIAAEATGRAGAAVGAYADVAARWHDFGVPYEAAQALLGKGRCLVVLGRAPEAAPVLKQARAIFKRLRAKPALEETDALLVQTGSVTQ